MSFILDRSRLALRPLVLLAGIAAIATGAPPPGLASLTITLDKEVYRPGDFPTLTFTNTGRREVDPVVFLFLGTRPNPFPGSILPPIFLGPLPEGASSSIMGPQVTCDTVSIFIQGALFDPTTQELVDVSNEVFLDVDRSGCGPVFLLDFTTEDDFATLLENGQDVSTPPEFGNLVSISSTGVNFGPAIFDTTADGPNAGGPDPDLLVDLGNALILQGNDTQTVPGIFDVPDDSRNGGTVTFAFVDPVTALSVDLIDMDAGGGAIVTLIDGEGDMRVYDVPGGWTGDVTSDGPPGYDTLSLTTLDDQAGLASTATATEDAGFDSDGVILMEVTLESSGALDNLSFEEPM